MITETPRYVDVGMKVIARLGDTTTGVICRVTHAAGHQARVVNERHGIDKWCRLDELRIIPESLKRGSNG